MAIINVYSDESGKFLDTKVISFCGLCASSNGLDRFEERWREALRRTQLSFLTMKDALRAHKQLSPVVPAQSVRERIEVLKPFAACLAETMELGVAIAVNIEAFRRTAPDIKREIAGSENPNFFAFLNGMLAVAKHGSEEDRISLICDDDQESAENYLRLYRRLKNLPDPPYQRLCSITFADDRVFLALQAADMLASLVRLQSDYEFYGKQCEYEPLFAYLAERNAPKYIRWAVAFIGEMHMSRVEMNWSPRPSTL